MANRCPWALLPAGVYRASTSRCCWCALTAPLHPYLCAGWVAPIRPSAVCFCGTLLTVTRTGRYPASLAIGEPGLSSTGPFHQPEGLGVCRVTPSAGDREESATETHRRWPDWGNPTRAQVRVQGCGKSAPAASRGAGSVNPGWEQGPGTTVGHDTRPDSSAPLEAVGNGGPRQMITPRFGLGRSGEQNPAYVLLSPSAQRRQPPP